MDQFVFDVEERDWAWMVTEGLERIYKKLGNPQVDIKSPTFWLMVDNIVQIWEKRFTQEKEDWLHDRKIDLAVERSVSESAKSGFARIGVYPRKLFDLLKGFYPDIPLNDKKFQRNFFNRYPIFKNTNYNI